MADSTLSLAKADYEVEVADFMGWGRDSADWSADDAARIRRDVGSGLRRFYYCTPPHDWTFLRPFKELTLASGDSTILLPEDCGGVEGKVYIVSTSGSYRPLQIQDPGVVQGMYAASPSQTGQPAVVSLRPVRVMPADRNQQFEMYVFPAADAAYTLAVQYYITPGYLLDPGMPYAYGGPEHSETILLSCLAVAEERRDNIPMGQGPNSIAFRSQLMASIAIDRRKRPQKMVMNNDHSDSLETVLWGRSLNYPAVTYNGVEYN